MRSAEGEHLWIGRWSSSTLLLIFHPGNRLGHLTDHGADVPAGIVQNVHLNESQTFMHFCLLDELRPDFPIWISEHYR